MKARVRSLLPVICLAATGALLGGCLDRELKPLNPCLVSGVVAEIAVTNIDKVDMLFMVDNSNSMKEEQESLRVQFERIIEMLTTGMRANGEPFPPAKDLHLGVVSSDMGLLGVQGIDNCTKNNGFGDDGVMQNTPSMEITGCAQTYPRFLTYNAESDDPMQKARDFACIASLGTGGCGFEQQLEAALKALWPANDPMPLGGPNPDCPTTNNRICFLGDTTGLGQTGHGDGANVGFLRNEEATGLSLVAIIMVTDEEDCSSGVTEHFTPDRFLPDGHPAKGQPLNLRCYYNKQNLYPLERYINGYKALRPGNENLVIFAAIVGVPEDLTTPERYAMVNWDSDTERASFYASIYAHPAMVETVDQNSLTPQGGGNLQPSCVAYRPDNTERTRAYPPVRIVKVAEGFGANGTVHSICQEDLGPAVDAIIDVIAKQLGAVCLPRPLIRNSDGLVGCNVVWELPPPGVGPDTTPRQCGQTGFEFLLPPDAGRTTRSRNGGQVCRVAQLRVVDSMPGVDGGEQTMPTVNDGVEFREGWFYDNFTDEVKTECTGETKQRVAFTPAAKPPTGVTVKLECLNETQSLADNRTNVATGTPQPNIGDSCEQNRETGCNVLLANGEVDTSMFCHPEFNVCVKGCSTSTQCPAAWVCDDRPETLAETSPDGTQENGRPYCVNPTCGTE